MKYSYDGKKSLSKAKGLMENFTETPVMKEHTEFRVIKKANDGNVYAIVKENQKYAIKKAVFSEGVTPEDFQYVTGASRRAKSLFENYSIAVKGLFSILKNTNTVVSDISLEESDITFKEKGAVILSETKTQEQIISEAYENDDEEIALSMLSECVLDNVLTETPASRLVESLDKLISEGEKFVMKAPAPKSEEEFGGEEDFGGEESPEFNDEDSFEGGEENFDADFDAGVEANEEESPEKYLQQLSGKIATSLRSFYKEHGKDDELTKFVVNSVLSAVDTSEMSEEDIDDMKVKLTQNNSEENEGGEETPEYSSEGDEDSYEETPEFNDEESYDGEESYEDEPIEEGLDKEGEEFFPKSDLDAIMENFEDKESVPNPNYQGKDEEPLIDDDVWEKFKSEFAPRNDKPSTGEPKHNIKWLSPDEVRAKFGVADDDIPLRENFNKNIEDYLVKRANPSIFAKDEEKKEVMTTETKPKTAPTETKPQTTPSRRDLPFQKPSEGPKTQPKFKG